MPSLRIATSFISLRYAFRPTLKRLWPRWRRAVREVGEEAGPGYCDGQASHERFRAETGPQSRPEAGVQEAALRQEGLVDRGEELSQGIQGRKARQLVHASR